MNSIGTRKRRRRTSPITRLPSSRPKADPFAIEFLDDREDYGEDRFVIIGMTEGRLLTVVYTLRADKARIISARRAEPRERRRYHDQDSQDRLD